MYTVKPVLSGHPRDPCYCPLNRGVCLVQVHFTEIKEEKLVFTEAQGVRLIQVSLYIQKTNTKNN